MDEQGTKMTCVLFGIDIDVYATIIQRGGHYQITNPMVKEVTSRFANFPGERQMFFTNSTEVERLNDGASASVVQPSAYTISSVPKCAVPDERYDMIFVVLGVDEEKQVHTKSGDTLRVREMYVTDDSTDKVILVSAWNKTIMRQYSEMAVVMHMDPVIMVTALKVSTFENFSLATTLSSELIFDSTSPRAVALREWAAANKSNLEQRLLIGHPYRSNYPFAATPVKDVLALTGASLKYGEVIKIDVRILDFIEEHKHIALGCSACGRTCAESITAVGQEATCSFCLMEMKAEPKLYYKFKCTDGTGTLQLDAYTKNVEKMFLIDSTVLYNLDANERKVLFARTQRRFRETVLTLIIAPLKNLLTIHKVIKWVLRDVLP